MRRNAKSRKEEEPWKNLYTEQKTKVQLIIKNERFKHEEKMAKEIREDKSNGKNIWKYIKMLKGEKVKDKEILLDNVYGIDGKKLEREEAKMAVNKYWKDIYGKHRNDIKIIWNESVKQEYKREEESIEQKIQEGIQYQVKREDDVNIDHVENCSDTLREHLEMALKVEGGVVSLQEDIINEKSDRMYEKDQIKESSRAR